jgi:hypothetical protein
VGNVVVNDRVVGYPTEVNLFLHHFSGQKGVVAPFGAPMYNESAGYWIPFCFLVGEILQGIAGGEYRCPYFSHCLFN